MKGLQYVKELLCISALMELSAYFQEMPISV